MSNEFDLVFDVNKIIVIESLKKEDGQTGRKLYDSIITKFPLKAKYFTTEFKTVHSKKDFNNALTEIAETVTTEDLYPYIHFEIHGIEKGFVLSSDGIITWKEMAPYLRKINIATGNNLFISMATCYGANIFKTIDIFKKAPFFGYIGSWQKLINEEISESFEEFFSELLLSLNTDNDTMDFNLSLTALNNNKIGFIYSEMIFDKVWGLYSKKIDDPKYAKQLKILVAQALSDRELKNKYSEDSINQLHYEISKKLSNKDGQKKFLKDTFLKF